MRKPDDAAEYGQQWYGDYDAITAVPTNDTNAAAAALAELAASGNVLEVAAGTGRVAIPLKVKYGLDVTATDASLGMLEQLRSKPGGAGLVTRQDILPEISVKGPFGVIAILANSIWVMQDASQQRQFLRNAALYTRAKGVLVIEMTVANPTNWAKPRKIVGPVHTQIISTEWSPVTQQVHHTFTIPTATQSQRREVYIRYITPNELLLMAELEGWNPRNIWSDWSGNAFTVKSNRMIAILER